MKRALLPRIITLLVLILAQGCAQSVQRVSPPTPENMRDVARARLAELPPAAQEIGVPLEPVALIQGPMPTGIAVSRSGRLFLSFPRWGDRVPATVGEVRNGRVAPFPDASMNRGSPNDFQRKFVSVQSVVIDDRDRLWALDTGNITHGDTRPGAAKLVGFDLSTDTVFKIITFPSEVVLSTSYVNDVRFDLNRGAEGLAFITDSSAQGPNGIIVVDLASGRSWRRLHDHPSTKSEPGFTPIVEGGPLSLRPRPGVAAPFQGGVDGIAIDRKNRRLYYTPLAGRHYYSVSVDALSDPSLSDREVGTTVLDHGERVFASDGLEAARDGTLYFTDYESNAIRRRNRDGSFTTLVSDRRLLWPDSLSLDAHGYLYVTANQLHRQPRFQGGKDQRKPPYMVFRLKTDNPSL